MKNKVLINSGIVLIVIIILLAVIQPPFIRNLLKRVDVSPQTGEMLVDEYGCRDCHKIDDRGALKAPNLDSITEDEDMETLATWLSNPRKVNPRTAMPNFKLSDTQVQAILAYLETLTP